MTVTTTETKNTATGDGSETSFPFTFTLFQPADITVYFDGVAQSILSGYTVDINSNNVGGTVDFDTAPDDGVAIIFVRSMEYIQPTELIPEGNLSETSLEHMADRNLMLIQQLKEILDRTSQSPIGGDADVSIPALVPLYVLRANSAGDALEFVSPATAFSDVAPDAGTGDVSGPASSVAHSLALYSTTTGKALEAGVALGTANDVLTSNGPGLKPSFQAPQNAYGAPGASGNVLTSDGAGGASFQAPSGVTPYISADTTVIDTHHFEFTHGLGHVPYIVQLQLVCVTANGGFSPGTILDLVTALPQSTSYFTVTRDATKIHVYTGTKSGGMQFKLASPTSNNATITVAPGGAWKFKIYAL